MSDAFTPGGTPDETEETGKPGDLAAVPAPQGGPVRRVVTGRRSRWVVGGVVVVVLVGGTAAVTAAAVHHHDGPGIAVRAFPGGVPALKQLMARGQVGAVGGVVVKNGQVVAVPGGALPGVPVLGGVMPGDPGSASSSLAPAPLPSLPADQAADKAAAAVSGGKVESLAAVPEQGGGSAWQAVVLGPDGVRHQVTVDGTSGAVTSNTVLG